MTSAQNHQPCLPGVISLTPPTSTYSFAGRAQIQRNTNAPFCPHPGQELFSQYYSVTPGYHASSQSDKLHHKLEYYWESADTYP